MRLWRSFGGALGAAASGLEEYPYLQQLRAAAQQLRRRFAQPARSCGAALARLSQRCDRASKQAGSVRAMYDPTLHGYRSSGVGQNAAALHACDVVVATGQYSPCEQFTCAAGVAQTAPSAHGIETVLDAGQYEP